MSSVEVSQQVGDGGFVHPLADGVGPQGDFGHVGSTGGENTQAHHHGDGQQDSDQFFHKYPPRKIRLLETPMQRLLTWLYLSEIKQKSQCRK